MEVGHTGLEPVTSCVSYKRASQLRQWPVSNIVGHGIVVARKDRANWPWNPGMSRKQPSGDPDGCL